MMKTKNTDTLQKAERWYAAIRNIPECFHSADLRCFFSQFIEEKGFACFHYKHRAEEVRSIGLQTQSSSLPKTYVCVTCFSNVRDRDRCISMYHGMNWIKKDGEYLKRKCYILKVSLGNSKSRSDENHYLTKGEKKHKQRHAYDETFTSSDLASLSELHPPVNVMPNGNVGTPIPIFLDLIKQCKLPPCIIKKLGLVFPKTGSNRKYGNVPFVYARNGENELYQSTSVMTATGFEIVDNDTTTKLNTDHASTNIKERSFVVQNEQNISEEEKEELSASDDDDDRCEEWERHEALHSDVTSQERDKERLFEEEIELKWEKGGSGLVFYTDAQYWAEQDGDFDEQTTDDWDVDMSEYYGSNGDRDAKQFIQIMKEKRLREGRNTGTLAKENTMGSYTIGHFERYTKGSGRRIMEKLGWKDGRTLGSGRSKGLYEPIEAEGQSMKERKGFGYHGERIRAKDDTGCCTTGMAYIPTRNQKRVNISDVTFYPIQRSVEPLASQSYLFPQFRSNLTSVKVEHKDRSSEERKKAVPGIDGIVLTTKYDDPLDIDVHDNILRSRYPTSLKRRKVSDTAVKQSELQPCKLSVVRSGSKLVNPRTRCSHISESYKTSSYIPTVIESAPLYSESSIKFVRPADASERLLKY